jgi:hypothetical protein
LVQFCTCSLLPVSTRGERNIFVCKKSRYGCSLNCEMGTLRLKMPCKLESLFSHRQVPSLHSNHSPGSAHR